MPSSLFQSSSQVSIDIRCTNCAVNIIRVTWKQCTICHQFNLCEECEQYPYEQLESRARENHIKIHQNLKPIDVQCIQYISVEGITEDTQKFERKFGSIMNEEKIQNDIDMSIIMAKLKQLKNQSSTESDQTMREKLCCMIVDYHMRAFDRKINILNLDGGGVRGYMPIRVLEELIIKEYLSGIENSNVNREEFLQGQLNFTNQFDYFAGTSTGGLIAFCLSIGYNILDLKDIYTRASYYFNRNLLGPIFCSKYNPSRIHDKIDQIIDQIQLKNGKKLSAKNATVLDIHNYLNPNAMIPDEFLKSTLVRHGNLLEFVDDDENSASKDDNTNFRRVKREKVLLITAYNASKDIITVFNTSYAKHWPYRIADVLKATMAAPTYFPPQKLSKGIVDNDKFIPNTTSSEIFIDGGIFANDPELIALWAIRMQWKKLVNYHIVSVGTGTYNTPLTSTSSDGYFGWLLKNGLLVNTLMQATSSLTEVISSNLAKLNNIKRMKLNYKLTEAMSLDDVSFVKRFDQEWENFKDGDDFRALVSFYQKYIRQ